MLFQYYEDHFIINYVREVVTLYFESQKVNKCNW